VPDTFDSSTVANASAKLPPLTAALRKTWDDAGPSSARLEAIASVPQMRKVLDAVNSLEKRVLALEGTPFIPS
jgi:hypothetical protein